MSWADGLVCCLERQLADDATERGRERKAERHQRAADRIRGLLAEQAESPAGEEQ
jgi:hypothetical protein